MGRYGGPEVAELVLEITPDVVVGKVCMLLISMVFNNHDRGARGCWGAMVGQGCLSWCLK
jgi:hypothetical protein